MLPLWQVTGLLHKLALLIWTIVRITKHKAVLLREPMLHKETCPSINLIEEELFRLAGPQEILWKAWNGWTSWKQIQRRRTTNQEHILYVFDTVYRDVIKTLFYLAFANKFNTGVSNEQGLLRLLRFRRPENQDDGNRDSCKKKCQLDKIGTIICKQKGLSELKFQLLVRSVLMLFWRIV